jgi:hypothetical protein
VENYATNQMKTLPRNSPSSLNTAKNYKERGDVISNDSPNVISHDPNIYSGQLNPSKHYAYNVACD